MPGVTLLGRRWQAASDDFVLPASLDAVIRATWLTLICYVIYRLYPSWECFAKEETDDNIWGGRNAIRAFLALCSILLLTQVITAALLAGESSKGGIMNVKARRFVAPLLSFRIFLSVLDVLWNAVGSAWIFGGHWPRCDSEPLAYAIIEGLLVFQWFSLTVLVLGLVSIYDPMGSDEKRWERMRRKWHQQNPQLMDGGEGSWCEAGQKTEEPVTEWEEVDQEIERQWHKLSSTTWRRRFRAWLCCSWAGDKRGSREAFKEVSELFSSLLRGTRLVPSDVAAGLVLLRIREKRERRQRKLQEQELERECIRCIPNILPPPSPDLQVPFVGYGLTNGSKEIPDWMKLDWKVARYLRFCQGSYGWPYLMYLYCITGLCRLIPKTTCCMCLRRSKPRKVEEDNCCLCGMAALRILSQVPEEDILYATFQNGYYQVPFVILIDHDTSSIVIAIRGSLTLRDIFTDFCAASTEMNSPELPPGTGVHKGMLQTANYVKKRIEESGVLKSAWESYPHYNLVITGHSLGAGVSAILAILMRPTYPDLRCYSFSPPAGLLTREAARYSERFVLTVGLGHDLVMRLGVDTIENLRTRLLDTLDKSTLPKFRILMSGCLYTFMGIPNKALGDDLWSNMGHEGEDKITGEKTLQEAMSSKNMPFPCYHGPPTSPEASVLDSNIGKRRFSKQRLYSPGRIMHLMYRRRSREEKLADSANGISRARFEVFWRQPEHFLQLEVMPRMVLDHLPEKVLEAINDVLLHHTEACQPT